MRRGDAKRGEANTNVNVDCTDHQWARTLLLQLLEMFTGNSCIFSEHGDKVDTDRHKREECAEAKSYDVPDGFVERGFAAYEVFLALGLRICCPGGGRDGRTIDGDGAGDRRRHILVGCCFVLFL